MKHNPARLARNAWLGAGLAVALGLAAVGCKDTTPKQGPAAVEFWHAMGGKSGWLIDQLAKEFNAANPDVWVLPRYQGGYSQFSQKLMAAAIARTNPPLAQMYSNWAARLIALDRIRPVEEFFPGLHGLTRAEIDDFFPALMADNEWGGRVYTLPFNKSAYVAYYNMAMLRQAGYNAPPLSWPEFRRAVRAMTREKAETGQSKVFGFGIRPRLEIFTALLFSAGGYYLTADDSAPDLGIEASASLAFLDELIRNDKSVYVDDDYPEGPFAARRIASFFSTSASIPYVDKVVDGSFEWATARLPTPDGRAGPMLFQGTNLGIFANHPQAVQEAAWRFACFLTSPKISARWAIGSGCVPVRYQSLSDPESLAYLRDNPKFRTAVDQIVHARFEPKPEYWDRTRRVAQDLVSEFIYGRLKPQQAVERLRREIRTMIEYIHAP